ncbi:hypothetical protein A1F96_10523, partial [Pyrenophora tritici-repentis]
QTRPFRSLPEYHVVEGATLTSNFKGSVPYLLPALFCALQSPLPIPLRLSISRKQSIIGDLRQLLEDLERQITGCQTTLMAQQQERASIPDSMATDLEVIKDYVQYNFGDREPSKHLQQLQQRVALNEQIEESLRTIQGLMSRRSYLSLKLESVRTKNSKKQDREPSKDLSNLTMTTNATTDHQTQPQGNKTPDASTAVVASRPISEYKSGKFTPEEVLECFSRFRNANFGPDTGHSMLESRFRHPTAPSTPSSGLSSSDKSNTPTCSHTIWEISA